MKVCPLMSLFLMRQAYGCDSERAAPDRSGCRQPHQCLVSTVDRVATLRVVDGGVRIAGEDLPRLFNRFERVEHRETSHVGGTGLGLYLSRELARQHGGDIQVESRPQAGSTFTLSLPLVAPAEAEPIESEPEQAAPRLHIVGADAEADAESQLA